MGTELDHTIDDIVDEAYELRKDVANTLDHSVDEAETFGKDLRYTIEKTLDDPGRALTTVVHDTQQITEDALGKVGYAVEVWA